MKKLPAVKKILVLGIVFLILLNFFKEKVRNYFFLFSQPIQKFFWQKGNALSEFFKTLVKLKDLKEENERLKSQILSLLAENASLKELKNENEFLRKALDLGLEKEFKLTLVEPTAKNPSQDLLTINKGKKEGLAEGMTVINQEKILVGKVQKVYDDFSKVALFTHKGISFDVKIVPSEGEREEIFGLAKGEGNLRAFVDFLPKEKEIKNGDLLITASLGGVFPEGFLVGKVKEVKKSDLEKFQKVEIEPLFDLNQTNFLWVVSNR
jgi:rod shape-determining protein MreC